MKTKLKEQSGNVQKKYDGPWLWELSKACRENVANLVESAELLLDNGYYAQSFALSYTALEEMGKDLIVCDYITDITSDSEFEAAFFDHKIKVAYQHSNCALENVSTDEHLKNYKATIVYNKEKYKAWFDLRQNSLYVGINKDTKSAKKPTDEVSEKEADSMLNHVKRMNDDRLVYELMNERIGSKAFYK